MSQQDDWHDLLVGGSGKAPRKGLKKRDAQLAEDWRWLANTPQGRRIIADLMVWGNVYNPINEDNPVALALAVGENNFAKRIAYLLAYHEQPHNYAELANEYTTLLHNMLRSNELN